MSKAILEAKNMKKSYGDLAVLKDISVQVKEGDVCVILGPSGSGKSTTLRLATMLEQMDDGSLIYEGKVACESKQGKAIYRGKQELKKVQETYGLVFQNFNLFPHYTVLKNVMDAPVSVLKREKKEAEKEARELLAKVGLEDKCDAYPDQLSGGQKQRVAIARALAMHPKILFFDEPTSALDPEITAGVLKILRDLAKEKMAMVIVTHEIAFARKVADHVIFMDGGVIVEEGRPEDVIDHSNNQRTRSFLKKLEEA